MPTKVQIEGVGTVELDDSFRNLSPKQQDATVQEIAATVAGNGGGHHTDYDRIKRNVGKMIDQDAPESDIDAYLNEEGVTAEQLRAHKTAAPSDQPIGSSYDADHWSPDAPGQPQPPEMHTFRTTDSAGKEVSFEAPANATDDEVRKIASDTFRDPRYLSGSVDRASGPKQDHPTGGPGFAQRQMASLNEGIADTVGAPVDLVASGMRKLGIPIGDEPVLGSAFIKDALHKVGIGQATADEFAPRSALERYTQAAARGVGANVVPLAGTLGAGSRLALQAPALAEESASLLSATGRTAKQIAVEAAKRPGTAVAAEALAGAGSGAGREAGSDLTGGSPWGELAGSMIGSVAGGSLTPFATTTPTSRFVARQITDNPHAAVDAGIAADVQRIADSIPTRNAAGRKLPAAQRQSTLLGRIADYERSLLNPADIDALDLAPSAKSSLRQAWANRSILSDEEVSALRGTPAGDAVADAVTKARRLRTLVPEGSPAAQGSGLIGRAIDALAPTIGSAVGGPSGALAANVTTQGIRAFSRRGGNPSAAAAQALAAQAPRYQAALAKIAPDAAPAASASLSTLAGAARDERFATRQAALAAKAREKLETSAREAEGKRLGALNARDNVSSGGGWRGYLEEQTGLTPEQQDLGAMIMVNRGLMSPAMLKLHLSDPAALQNGNAGNHFVDRLNALAEAGELSRKPGWTPPTPVAPVATTASGETIRNPLAYSATAAGNQARNTQAIAATRDHRGLSDTSKTTVATAASEIGNTSSRETAEGVLSTALASVPATEREAAKGILSPLIVQKRSPGALSGGLPADDGLPPVSAHVAAWDKAASDLHADPRMPDEAHDFGIPESISRQPTADAAKRWVATKLKKEMMGAGVTQEEWRVIRDHANRLAAMRPAKGQ